MNNLPQQTLRRITAKYGKEIAGNAERCKGLLNDLCGSHRREINVLVTAIEERIPLDLLASARSIPAELLLARLEKRLAEQTGLTAEAASWAVESWALALDVVTDSQIAARALKQSESSRKKAGKIKASDNNESTNSDFSPYGPVADKLPPKTQTNQSSTKTSPVNNQPIKIPFPTSSPPVRLPTSNRPPVQTPATNQPQTSNQPAVSRTRFRLFRGCLIFVFILIVSFGLLLFAVPYAVEKMRETQRTNEQPRFPVR